MTGSCLLDRGALDDPFHLPVEANPDQSDLRDTNVGAFDRHPLGDTEGVRRPLPTLALRVRCPFLKEVDEGPVEVAEGLLQRLRVAFLEESGLRLLFQQHQFRGKLVVSDALAALLRGGSLSFQRPVPKEAPATRKLAECLLLGRRWVEAKAIAAQEFHRMVMFSQKPAVSFSAGFKADAGIALYPPAEAWGF